jgi:hypothetical protein
MPEASMLTHSLPSLSRKQAANTSEIDCLKNWFQLMKRVMEIHVEEVAKPWLVTVMELYIENGPDGAFYVIYILTQ